MANPCTLTQLIAVKNNIDEIKQLNVKPAVCEKGKRNTPLTDEQKKIIVRNPKQELG